MNIPDDLDKGEIGMDGTGLKRGSHVNYITILILDAHGSVLGIVAKQEEQMVLWSDQVLGHVTVHTVPLYWRKKRGHGRLGATLMLLGNM